MAWRKPPGRRVTKPLMKPQTWVLKRDEKKRPTEVVRFGKWKVKRPGEPKKIVTYEDVHTLNPHAPAQRTITVKEEYPRHPQRNSRRTIRTHHYVKGKTLVELSDELIKHKHEGKGVWFYLGKRVEMVFTSIKGTLKEVRDFADSMVGNVPFKLTRREQDKPEIKEFDFENMNRK